MLFDTSPEEPQKKPRRAKVAPPPAETPAPQNGPSYRGQSRAVTLGRIDGVYECPDESCGADAFDIVDEARGQWVVQCCFCGTSMRGAVIQGYLKPRGDGFVFNDGRFAGMTIEEAWDEPRGRDYVTWAAASHIRQAVRDACKKHLDSLSAAT